MTTKKKTPVPVTPPKVIYYAIAGLLLFFLFAISFRLSIQQDGKLPAGDSAWTISLTHQIEVHDKGAMIQIAPPWDTRFARLFAQSLSHTGLHQKRTKADSSKRDIILIAPATGVFTAQTIFSVHVSSLPRGEAKKSTLSEDNRSQWLSPASGVEINTTATTAIVERLSKNSASAEETIEKLFNYVSNNIRINQRASSDSEKALAKKRGTVLGSNHALLALLRTAHLPARLVTGVNLQAAAAEQPAYWVEVYDAEAWIPLDPANGYLKNLPPYFIPMRRGGEQLVIIEKATVRSTTWKINTVTAPKGLSVSDSKNLLDVFDLNRLSPTNREKLGVLLLLPLSVLATEIMRHLMGIRTYGTFSPSLLALSVVHVDRTTALIVFLLVTVIGITIRAYLPNLNLERTARLSIVFTLVSISMALVMSGFIYFDPSVDSAVVLLPVVVLTMLVDRIYSVADQRGMHTAMIRLMWTAVAAVISFFVLLQSEWSIWLVAYPEIHLVTLAVIILVGLYQGKKLSELPVLSWLHEPAPRKSRSTDRANQSGQSGDKE